MSPEAEHRLRRLTRILDFPGMLVGKAAAWLIVPMIGALVYEVIARFGFNSPTMWAYDATFMFYGALFMLGAAYTLGQDSHVRADFLFNILTPRWQGIIDGLFTLVLFFPAMYFFTVATFDYAMVSWMRGERIPTSPMMPIIYPLKTVMPITGALLLIQGVSELLKSYFSIVTNRRFRAPGRGGTGMTDATLGLVSLGLIFVGLLTGYPMAFTFIFISLVFGWLGMGDRVISLMQYQFFALMRDTTLAAIPLFLFMGFVLEQSGLMERMFKALRLLLGRVRGSLYLIVLLVATVFAAATGIVGASVTVLGVMAAPMMMQSGYDTRLSAGAIAAGGTLGILIPPSILLIVMGPVVGVPVSDLFTAAIIPGLMLSTAYIAYTLIKSYLNPELGPPLSLEEINETSGAEKVRELLLGIIPVTVVIAFTLGVIIGGVATPTDAAASGALASLVLALVYRRMSWPSFKKCVYSTLTMSAMIMFLLGSANFFGAVFSRLGSANLLTDYLLSLPFSPTIMLMIILAIVFVLGSPLEWIPIVLVIVPIFLPTMVEMGYDPLWFSILIAVTLQTSWLTPPMALSAYFLKGVVPQWKMGDIYLGMTQFVVLQLIVVALLVAFPQIVLWLPNALQ